MACPKTLLACVLLVVLPCCVLLGVRLLRELMEKEEHAHLLQSAKPAVPILVNMRPACGAPMLCATGLGMLGGGLPRKLTEKEERALAAEQERAAKKQMQAAAKDAKSGGKGRCKKGLDEVEVVRIPTILVAPWGALGMVYFTAQKRKAPAFTCLRLFRVQGGA
eukprot:1149081-Pelagomonas_calceolata.AAC.8